MFYHIFSAYASLSPEDKPLARVVAKKNLYDHIETILPAMRVAQLNQEEIENELLQGAMQFLHPSFTGDQCYEELQTMFAVCLMEIPSDLHSRFTVAYFKFISAKLQTHVKNSKKKSSDGH